MKTTIKNKPKEKTVKTETLESPPKFPCKANCLDCCGDHLCRDLTCRAPPVHGHVTFPCRDPYGQKWEALESSSWTTLTDAEIHADYPVEEVTLVKAAMDCINYLCPSQEKTFYKLMDEATDQGRMVIWYPECLDWSVEDVANFIKSLGFPHAYENCFRKNAIDGNKLYLCNSNRLVDMAIRDWKDIRIITAAIRQILKIGYPKDEIPLKQPRISVQSLYEFWLRKRAYYSLGNENKAKNYGFRQFLNEYKLSAPEVDHIQAHELASQFWLDKLMKAGQRQRKILIQELRSEPIPHWIENKNEIFPIKGVAGMPADDATAAADAAAATADDVAAKAVASASTTEETRNVNFKTGGGKGVHFGAEKPESNIKEEEEEEEEEELAVRLGRPSLYLPDLLVNVDDEDFGQNVSCVSCDENDENLEEVEKVENAETDVEGPPSVHVIAPE